MIVRSRLVAFAVASILLAADAAAQVNDDVLVRRVPGGLEISWSPRPPGWTWDLYRSADPAAVTGGIPIAAGLASTAFQDLAPPPGLVIYGLHGEPPPAGCVDDAFEENDTSATAAALPPGWQQLQRCAGDDDWFSTTLLAGQSLRAGITYDSTIATLSLELRDSGGALLTAPDPYSVLFTAAASGSYLLRVTGDAAAETPYRMLLEAPFSPPPCDPDYASPNHSLAAAIPGWPEDDVWTDMAMCDGTEDWWTETIPPDYTLEVWVDPFFPIAYDLSDPSWYIVELYDTDGTTMLLQLDSRHGATGFDWSSTTGGTFFVRVRAHITTYDFWDHSYEIGATGYMN